MFLNPKPIRTVLLFYLSVVFLSCCIFTNYSFGDEAEAYLFTARKLFEKGRYEEAVMNFEKASVFRELSAEDLALQGISYAKLRDFDSSKKVLDRARVISPNSGVVMIALGVYYFEKGEFREAYYYFKKASERLPDSIEAKSGMLSSLVNIGVSEYKENPDIALVYFKRALEMDPNFVPALQNCGVIAIEKGDIEKALYYFNKAISVQPDNTNVLKLLYYIYGEKKDKEKQLDILKKLVSLQPYDPNLWGLYGRLLHEMGITDESIEAFKRARRLNSDDPFPYFKLAEYYLRMNNREKALYCIKESIGKSAYLLGQLQLEAASRLKDGENSITGKDILSIKRIVETMEEPRAILLESLKLLRKICKTNGEYKDEINSLISRYPHTVQLQVALGKYYEEQRDWNSALSIWERIIREHLRNLDAIKGLALVYEMKGDLDRAVHQYKLAIDVEPNDKSSYEHLISIYARRGLLEELHKEWKERVYLEPRNPVLLRELAKLEMMLGMLEESKAHMQRAEKVERENAEYERKKGLKKK